MIVKLNLLCITVITIENGRVFLLIAHRQVNLNPMIFNTGMPTLPS